MPCAEQMVELLQPCKGTIFKHFAGQADLFKDFPELLGPNGCITPALKARQVGIDLFE